MPAGPIDARNRFSWNDVVVAVPPSKDHESRVGAQSRQCHHPPDVPDQRKSHEGGEERTDEAGRAVPRHLDIEIAGGLRADVCFLALALLDVPIGPLALDARRHGEVEGGRWGGRRPFERAPVPGIAGPVAKRLAPANADDELYDLQNYSGQD